MQSAGRVRNHNKTFDRQFCKQMSVMHLSRGGSDVSKKLSSENIKHLGGVGMTATDGEINVGSDSVGGASQDRLSIADLPTGSDHPSRLKATGGVFTKLRNLRLKAHKQAIAPNRPLTKDERREFGKNYSRRVGGDRCRP